MIKSFIFVILITATIGLSGKFVPMLKENWNAENLNFSIHLLNYIGRHELSEQPNIM